MELRKERKEEEDNAGTFNFSFTRSYQSAPFEGVRTILAQLENVARKILIN